MRSSFSSPSELKYGMAGFPITWEKLWFSSTTRNTCVEVGTGVGVVTELFVGLEEEPPHPTRANADSNNTQNHLLCT